MMKSYEHFFLGLYGAIFDDIASWYPTLRKSLMLDKARLLSLVESRGLSFLTIDLPNLGKHFERSLSESTFLPSHLPGSHPKWKGKPIPRLFSGMVLKVFDEFGVLRADADPLSILCLRQLYYTAKKARLECTDERTWKQVRDFYDIDRRVRSASLEWDADELGDTRADQLHFGEIDLPSDSSQPLLFQEEELTIASSSWATWQNIQSVCDVVSSQLGVFDASHWRMKHGPGAVSDMRAGKSSKYSFPSWPEKLDRVFPMADFAFANYHCWADSLQNGNQGIAGFSPHEPPSRLLAVPKTQKGPRLIAAEPTSHQWCQQSVKDFLSERLTATCIGKSVHFRDQTFNQKAAKSASLHQKHWTIDLSSASDRIGCWHVERLFRRNRTLLLALHASRTRWIENSIDRHSPRFHRLRKFSTMGSACTFPVQSILFTCVMMGVLLTKRALRPTIANISRLAQEVLVFGDDIIVPEDVGQLALDALGDLGFKVNHDKTFGTGRFRESCGCDAYAGVDVTPTYTSTYPEKSRPESIISAVAVHNNFFRSHWYTAATYLKSTVLRRVPFIRIPSVAHDSGVMGWVTHGQGSLDGLRIRLNKHLHRAEALFHVMKTRNKRLPDTYTNRLLQYFTEAPDPTVQWESGVPVRPKLLLKLRWEDVNAVTG